MDNTIDNLYNIDSLDNIASIDYLDSIDNLYVRIDHFGNQIDNFVN